MGRKPGSPRGDTVSEGYIPISARCWRSTIKVIGSGIPGARDYVVAVQFESGAVGTLNFASEQIPEKEFIYF